MKRFILVVASFLAAGSALFAGPETYSGKEMKQVAPPAPECPNWTGFYIGVSGGYQHADTHTDLRLTGDWILDDPVQAGQIEDRGTGDQVSTNGGDLGGVLGFNWQFNHWVIGAEAAGSYTWLRDSANTGSFLEFRDEYRVSTSFDTHYLATFGPRLGYAFCRWLPYVTGGLALGDVDFAQEISIAGSGPVQGGRTSETRVGWMVGGGLQYAITNHWSARVEYKYDDLGSVGFNHAFVGAPTFSGNSSFDFKEHNASAALIYQF